MTEYKFEASAHLRVWVKAENAEAARAQFDELLWYATGQYPNLKLDVDGVQITKQTDLPDADPP